MTHSKSLQKNRFALGARVVVGMSGRIGTVLHVDEEPSANVMGEYVHVVQTNSGELRVAGCDLELVPTSQTNQESVSEEQNDSKFMRMAIEEARKSISEDDNRPHPKVGAVVVKDGQILCTAYRGEHPGNHAEYVALERKLRDADVSGATVYTTLEPCTSRNGPKIPCAERLVERKVARVVIGMPDPNPDIRGRGDQLLSDAGIEVQLFPRELRAQVEDMNREFIRSQRDRQASTKMPTTPEFYNFNGSLGPISLSGIQHSVKGPWMDVWGLVTVVNPTQSHMKISLHRLVLDGKECPVQRLFFRLKSDPREQFERISLMGNAKEHYEVHVMFPETDYPTPPPRAGELWVSSNGQEPFPVKVRCP